MLQSSRLRRVDPQKSRPTMATVSTKKKDTTRPPVRIVGIVGASRGGSTFLSRLFATGAPTYASVGEIHWLIDRPRNPGGACPVCRILRDGKRCPLFGGSWLSHVTAASLYMEVAAAAGCAVLVSSDKAPMHYKKFVPEGKMDGVFLYKTPHAMAASALRGHPEVQLEGIIMRWRTWYTRVVSWAEHFCRRLVFVGCEQLADDPQGGIDTICRALELPPIADVVGAYAAPPNWHTIGGNVKAYERSGIFVDDRWRTELTAKQIGAIDTDEGAANLYQELRKKSVV